ncbi:restriction endonuclease [Gigaspora margarita]|uniref:Restriction endonuclease n=1 Tax=Gigaspora margarita TaxID=4874 RepID=A0A8H4AVM9_GIGMA|nr:restriction endonuclease [Gigaspora margarita]
MSSNTSFVINKNAKPASKDRQFEFAIIEELLKRKIKCIYSGGSKDGGVDIYVNIYGIKFVVQCKNWIKEIGPSVIQSLDGTLTQQPKGTIGVVVVPDNDRVFISKQKIFYINDSLNTD